MEHYHCYIVLRVESCAYDDVGKKVWLLKSAGRKNVKVGSINNLWMRGRGYKRHHNARTPSGVQRTSTPDDTLLFKNIDGPRKNRVAAKKNTLKIILTGYLWSFQELSPKVAFALNRSLEKLFARPTIKNRFVKLSSLLFSTSKIL